MIKRMEERFQIFRDLIESINPIYITEFNADYEIIYSNNPNAELFTTLFTFELAGAIPYGEELNSVAGEITRPVIFTNPIGMTWIADVYMEDGKLQRIFLLGPVFLDDISIRRIEAKMMLIQLAADAKRQFLELLQGLPVITLNRYYDFGIMLHRAIKEEIISRSDFLYPDMYDDHLTTEGALMDYHGVHQAERRMCRMIEEGNLHYQKEQDAIFSVSDNLVRNVTGDHLRQLKNTAIVLCTLYARAAIRGGVEAETVYTTSDFYIQKVEEAKKFTQVRHLIAEMAESFARMVSRHKLQSGMSPKIKKACDYIGTHLEENISIQKLAAKMGYSDYYFSTKFKKETGVSFREYVRNKRIEKGKEMLRDSNLDI